jgi:PAS domain S-box-containing protein
MIPRIKPSRRRNRSVSKKPLRRLRSKRTTSPFPGKDLRPFFDAPLDLLCIGDEKGTLLKLNPQWETTTGFSLSELIGRPFTDFVHPDDSAAVRAAFDGIDPRKGLLQFTGRIRCKDGSYRWLEWKIRRRGGYFYSSARDITDRMEMEEDIRESRQMLQTILDAIPVRVFWKDLQSRYLGGNQAFAEDLGMSSPAEIIGRTDFDLAWKEQAGRYRSDDRAVMRSGVAKLNYQEPGTLTGGRRNWIRTSKIPLRDLQGNIRGVLGAYEDITEQKQAEAALRESEERYQRISRTITDYIFHVRVENGKAVETLHGRRCREVTGYTVEEFRADPDLWLRMVDLEDRPLVQNQTRTILECRDAPVIEHRLWRKDGARRWVRNTPVPHRTPGGTLLGYDGVIQDITERKEAELQIHTLYKLTLALNATPDMQKGLRLFLDAALRISGLEAGGVFLRDERTGALDLAVYRALKPGGTVVEHLDADSPQTRWMMEGKPIYAALREFQNRNPPPLPDLERYRMMASLPIRYENRIIGFLNLVSATVDSLPLPVRENLETTVAQIGNAIGRLRIEAALRESRRMLEDVLDTIPARVWWKDRNSVYLGCNRSFAWDAGYESPADLIGKDDFQMGWKELADRYRADDRMVVESGQPKLNYEEPEVLPNGSRIWVSTSKIPLRDLEGNIRGVLGTYEDITERKRAEKEIRTLNAELEQRVALRTEQLEATNRELEAFSYSVSHDLRAPLRAIDGFTRVLEEDYGPKLDPEGMRLCGVIRRNTGHMNELIDDLLSFSRLSRTEMDYRTVDMEAMARSVFQELVPGEARRRVDFRITRLPRVAGDPALLRQVWSNLISNAVKFSQKRTLARIEVECRSTPEEDVFSIRDNGSGFDMRYADRLFGVFQRLHSASEFEGTGVGLAIVQRIIHRHGGQVWAEGEADKGAVFYFALPRSNREPIDPEEDA